MAYIPAFENALVALPAVIAIDALVPGGIEAVDTDVYDALRRDRIGAALDAAEAWYERTGSEHVPATIVYAILLHETEARDEALDVVEAGRQHASGSLPLQLAEAEIRMEQGREPRARELLDGVVEQGADDPEAADPGPWRFAGDLYLDLGDEDEALDCYERAERFGTDNYETLIRLAQLHREREHWRRAAECFERAADVGGNVVGPWREAAECWQHAGRLHEALEAREHVLSNRETDPDDWAEQGLGYRRVGELGDAIEALEKATRLGPHRPEYWIELAHLYLEVGRVEEAIRGYEEVLSHDEDFIEALDGLAAAALEQGDLELAEETAREALELDETHPTGWAHLGRALRARNETEEAIEAFERATELAPDTAEYLQGLSDALLDAGRREEGLEALRRAVEHSAADTHLAMPYAEALLRAREVEELLDFADSNTSGTTSPQWRLMRPIFKLVADGLGPRRLEPSEILDTYPEIVARYDEHLPLERDLDTLQRMVLVLEAPRSSVVEIMLDVLRGLRDPEELEESTLADT